MLVGLRAYYLSGSAQEHRTDRRDRGGRPGQYVFGVPRLREGEPLPATVMPRYARFLNRHREDTPV